MALKISEKGGVLTLKGNLTSKTAKALGQHLKFLEELKQEVKVNIDHLKKVDTAGQVILKKLRDSNCIL